VDVSSASSTARIVSLISDDLNTLGVVTFDPNDPSDPFVEMGIYRKASVTPDFAEPSTPFDANALIGTFSGRTVDAVDPGSVAPTLNAVYNADTLTLGAPSASELSISGTLGGMSVSGSAVLQTGVSNHQNHGVFKGTVGSTYTIYLLPTPDGSAFVAALCTGDTTVCGDGAGGPFAVNPLDDAAGGWALGLFTKDPS